MEVGEVTVASSGENAHRACANPSGLGIGVAQERPGPERGDGIPPPLWRKSSYSAYNGGCVEVARLRDAEVGVRDTKDLGTGPVLNFGAGAWGAFLSGMKNGEFTIAPEAPAPARMLPAG